MKESQSGGESPRSPTRKLLRSSETRPGYLMLCLVLWSVISFLLVSRFVIATVVVEGSSMVPTLRPGDRFVMSRLGIVLRELQRGDLVVLKHPGEETHSVKRIIGLPHETVELRDGHVLVNGRRLRESYLPYGTLTVGVVEANLNVRLKEEEYFVLGDNRMVSEDSRFHGPIRRDRVVGLISP